MSYDATVPCAAGEPPSVADLVGAVQKGGIQVIVREDWTKEPSRPDVPLDVVLGGEKPKVGCHVTIHTTSGGFGEEDDVDAEIADELMEQAEGLGDDVAEHFDEHLRRVRFVVSLSFSHLHSSRSDKKVAQAVLRHFADAHLGWIADDDGLRERPGWEE